MMKLIMRCVVLSLVMVGCASPSVPNPATEASTAPAVPEAAPVAAFQELIKRDGSLTFRSWGGKLLGMDSDTELRFFPDGKVEMAEYGIGLTTYQGRYRLDSDGRLTVEFKDFGQPWPPMLLERDEKSLLLKRNDDSNAFVMGNRGGATIPGAAGTYWPLRPIPASEVHARK